MICQYSDNNFFMLCKKYIVPRIFLNIFKQYNSYHFLYLSQNTCELMLTISNLSKYEMNAICQGNTHLKNKRLNTF